MEHSAPEQIFSTEASPVQGISTVKAIALANTQGQKIWTIDQNNVNEALATINLSNAIESEIRNSVFAGNIVAPHKELLSFVDGSNVGDVLLDPETGVGAYKISDGDNEVCKTTYINA